MSQSHYSNFGRALASLCEHYGTRASTLPPHVLATMVADVLDIWTRDGVTFRYAVQEFDRHIGNNVELYALSIVEV